MENETFIMSPKVDFAFKEIMMNPKVRKGFLSAVLDVPADSIKETKLLNTALPKIHEDEKQSILDVYLVMNDDTEINIEIQLAYMSSWADRSAFYVSKMLVGQIGVNKKYSNLKKCIGINLLDFNYIKETQRFHTTFHISEDTEHIRYTDIMEWHIVELPKLPQIDDGTDLYDWVRFIKAESKEEFEMAVKGNEYLEAAYRELEVISQDTQKRIAYTTRQKALFDYNTLMEENWLRGLAEGEAKGKAEERKSMAERMRAKGYSEKEIQELLS